jgi:hypothetical protein
MSRKMFYKKGSELEDFDSWRHREECECGGPLFKYKDITRNVYVTRCGHIKETYDIKQKVWVKSKKQPCSFVGVYFGEKPAHVKKEKAITAKKLPNPNHLLHARLNLLFKNYPYDRRNTVLQEIDHIVKFHLQRKTKMESETMEQYYTRIFSRPIIDKYIQNIDISKYQSEEYELDVEDPDDSDVDESNEDSESDITDFEDPGDESEIKEIEEGEEGDNFIVDEGDVDDDAGSDAYDYD